MADDGRSSNKPKPPYKPQETFQRSQETQVEHKFPARPPGIVNLPPGSRGPRSLYLKRYGDSFGFTLRHFIIYPPENSTEDAGRHAAVGALRTPMDTIFVKSVKEQSSARQAGLQRGDRIVAVNGISVTDKKYSDVVQLIQKSPNYLHLLVVPKEEDILQKYFAETAYNPASNQPDRLSDRQSAQHFLTKALPQRPREFQVDAASWRYLQNPYIYQDIRPVIQRQSVRCNRDRQHTVVYDTNRTVVYDTNRPSAQRALYRDDLVHRAVQREEAYPSHQELYARINPHEVRRQRSRAQPQVPLYKRMGRRLSEDNVLSDQENYWEPVDYSSLNSDLDMVVSNTKMKTAYKPNHLSDAASQTSAEMHSLSYPSAAASCRLSLDSSRRKSSSSVTSSMADDSKDNSCASYESLSRIGSETDDNIMTQFRKKFQMKEEFFRSPVNPVEPASVQREFYSRPNKMERSMWPPNETPIKQESRTVKPTHQNFERVKNDIENERDLTLQQQQYGSPGQISGGQANNVPPQKIAKSPKERPYVSNLGKIQEAQTAPMMMANVESVNGATMEEVEELRGYPLQIVHKRAKQFESGVPLPEDDPSMRDRTSFHKSELARITSKKVVPNVTERAIEYETKIFEPRRDNSGTSTNSGSTLKRIQRDTRSLDSSGSNTSSGSIPDVLGSSNKRLSGNVTISTGSKFIHVPPPSEQGKPITDTPEENQASTRVRARSNSAESWVAALQDDGHKRITRQDAIADDGNKARDQEAMEVTANPPYADLPPLIPESVEHIQLAPAVSVTPAPSNTKPNRPTQLNLDGPLRPQRHLKPSSVVPDLSRRSLSPVTVEDRPVVVKRRTKNTNLADEERAMRRESYLKATEGGRVRFDSDLSDGGDISPQMLRSAHRRWRPPIFPGNIQPLCKLFEDAEQRISLGGSGSVSGNSNSSASLDREKGASSPLDKDKYHVIREGPLHCKITEIDGKRAGDRSWKPVWAQLRGPKLFLFKDKNHQSPIGSDAVEHSLSSGIDMRESVVRFAEDYTKRKHVLRVSSLNPCRSELLLQAENTDELADWVKILQEQVATTTDIEAKLDPLSGTKQQAVPQTVPACTTIQVEGSRLSPQPNKSKTTSVRNRSPTGQSPVSKTRKPSQVPDPSTSPKSKTWRGKVVNKIRRLHQGASSPSSPTAPEVSTFGIPLDQCIPSESNQYVPRLIEACIDIVDDRGLETVGIYRVPGNNASITALTDEINRNHDDVPQEDPRWNDLHVVSSLLKSFLRKLPDSVVTNTMYPNFLKADKIEDPQARMEELRRLVKNLPPHNYHTLKYVIKHLRRVVDNCDVNKMEAKNLAIVFGPTIVRAEEENMQSMVNNMTHQCRIVETLLNYCDWFFSDGVVELPMPTSNQDIPEDLDSAHNQALLLDNITKYEASLKDQKEKNGALFTSIISAAQRKVKRKTTKTTTKEYKEESLSSNGVNSFNSNPYSTIDLKTSTTTDDRMNAISPPVRETEKSSKAAEKKVPWFNYSTDAADLRRRVENFEQETKAMLEMPRKSEICVNLGPRQNDLSSSAGSVNQNNTRLSVKQIVDPHALTKTHSASNVFTRTVIGDNNTRNSLDNSQFTVQYVNNKHHTSDRNSDCVDARYSSNIIRAKQNYMCSDSNRNALNSERHSHGAYSSGYSETSNLTSDRRSNKCTMRRGSSVENINSSSMDLSSNGNLKKVKYENESNQRTGSLDSLHKIPSTGDDDTDLVTAMTQLYDEKLKEKRSQVCLLTGEGLPYADESPEKIPSTSSSDKENIPLTSELYRNPSLHKNQYATSKSQKQREDVKIKESKSEKEKDVDTSASENVPDNERHISTHKLTLLPTNTNKLKLSLNLTSNGSTKLKRSESLNKPERTVSPLNIKLKRSESLNKTGDKLKRSDSLTKNEKTESNISKRREFTVSVRKSKEFIKLKRKNGMPDRSIKRRHTVGGTKDPDKITWLDNKNQDDVTTGKEGNKEKNLRTSSPDLSSTRRERLYLEISLIAPENMVKTLRQHLMGARPQSFPDTAVFKVPLESHV